jgi:transcriptional regulator with XRE-family HTH domain
MERKHSNLIKIGKKIKELRKKRKLSQEYLAHEASLGRGYFGRIERGEQNVSVQNLIKIAIILHVDPAKLLPSLRELKMPPAAKNSNR